MQKPYGLWITVTIHTHSGTHTYICVHTHAQTLGARENLADHNRGYFEIWQDLTTINIIITFSL